MTAATTGPAAQPAAGPPAFDRPGFGRLMLAEWTKIRTVRSTLWSLILLIVLDLGFTALFVGLTVAQWDNMTPGDRAQVTADPVSMILGSGFFLSQLTICVLGVLVIASEYPTGMIRASLLAVPRRLPMLWAKAPPVHPDRPRPRGRGVVRVVLHRGGDPRRQGPGLPRRRGRPARRDRRRPLPGDARTVLHGHRSDRAAPPGGITGVIGFVLVLAPLAALLPGSIGEHIHAYLPSEAGTLIAKAHQGENDLLTPWQGYGVFALWTVVLLALAAFLLKSRDA